MRSLAALAIAVVLAGGLSACSDNDHLIDISGGGKGGASGSAGAAGSKQALEAQIPNDKFQIPNKFQHPMFQIQKDEIFQNALECL